MQKLGSYNVHSQKSELIRVYIKQEKQSESAELSRPSLQWGFDHYAHAENVPISR